MVAEAVVGPGTGTGTLRLAARLRRSLRAGSAETGAGTETGTGRAVDVSPVTYHLSPVTIPEAGAWCLTPSP
jgi:hypothetical protein